MKPLIHEIFYDLNQAKIKYSRFLKEIFKLLVPDQFASKSLRCYNLAMLKKYFTLFIIFSSINTYSATSPDEVKIYFHLHQATRWAELHHSNKVLFSKQEMGIHLGKLKYSEVSLVKSNFYKEYLFLVKLSQNLKSSSILEIERFRESVHSKAERLNVENPNDWQSEFVLFR